MKNPTPIEIKMAHAMSMSMWLNQRRSPAEAFALLTPEEQRLALADAKTLLFDASRAGLVVSVRRRSR